MNNKITMALSHWAFVAPLLQRPDTEADLLVPKLQLGNPVHETLASRNQTGSWSFQDCIPKLELRNEENSPFS